LPYCPPLSIIAQLLEEVKYLTQALGSTFWVQVSISFMVYCENQEEIDYHWKELSAVPEAEQCGWLKDKYGLSWQIVPAVMDEMMQDQDPERLARVTQAFLKMKKFDLDVLQTAYDGK
jgi:predicted 3-demethylubiquinone-9 3-methyltransferase (glyoxalase superfamily)